MFIYLKLRDFKMKKQWKNYFINSHLTIFWKLMKFRMYLKIFNQFFYDIILIIQQILLQ